MKELKIEHSDQQLNSDTINPALCPLCNKSNHCEQLACCDSNKACWCQDPTIQFPESLLKTVPKKAKDKACICKACVSKYIE